MDKVILIASSNQGKIREISAMLAPYGFKVKTLKDFSEITPPEETGKSFFENAFIKAKYYAEKTGLPALADDSGLEVDALNGAPGIYSARFAGENATDEENNKKLLELLKDVPEEKRGARFVCVMVLYHPSGKYLVAEGVWEGRIATSPRGSHGFGYDPLFLVKELGYQKTSAEILPEEKNRLSHRAKALKDLVQKISEFWKEL